MRERVEGERGRGGKRLVDKDERIGERIGGRKKKNVSRREGKERGRLDGYILMQGGGETLGEYKRERRGTCGELEIEREVGWIYTRVIECVWMRERREGKREGYWVDIYKLKQGER